MITRYLILTFIYVFSSLLAISQDDEKPKTPLSERMYFGGGIGLTFGTVTAVNINPILGYKFTPKFSLGASLTYQYFKRKDEFFDYESNNYGGSTFARYRFIEEIYGHIEYAAINYDVYNISGEVAFRTWIPFLLLGAGYSSQIGDNSVIFLQLLFDVLENQYSPYEKGEPIYSVGIGIGF